MTTFNKLLVIGTFGLITAAISGCESDATSSGASTAADASHCVDRALRRIYTNKCNYDVYVRLLDHDKKAFRLKDGESRTRSASRKDFGACRAPSSPILNSDATDYTCGT